MGLPHGEGAAVGSPALSLIRGEGPRPLTVLIAEHDVWYWEVGFDQAHAAMLAAPLGRLLGALDRCQATREQLAAARRRLEVARAQAAGRPWLHLAGGRI